MDINMLRTFVTLADLGNFTLVADKLNVVQSTVSTRIRELEKEVGQPLFVRDYKNLRLTDVGKSFLNYANQIIKLTDSAFSDVNRVSSFKDSLYIGAVPTLYDCYLADYLYQFLKDNRKTSVKIVLDHSQNLFQQLYSNSLDICFTYDQFYQSEYQNVFFRSDPIVLATSSENRDYINGITNEQLRVVTLLYCDIIENQTSWLRQIFSQYHTHFLDIDTTTKIIPILKKGLGYALLPKKIIEKELAEGSLIEIPLLEMSLPPLDCYVLIKKSGQKKKALLKWLELVNS